MEGGVFSLFFIHCAAGVVRAVFGAVGLFKLQTHKKNMLPY